MENLFRRHGAIPWALAALAVVLAVLVVLWFGRGEQHTVTPKAAPVPAVPAPTPAAVVKPPAPAPKPAPKPTPVPPTTTAPPGAILDDAGRILWQPQPEIEFEKADVETSGRGVNVGIGSARARIGEEFTVDVKLDAPPLESLVVALRYDPAVAQVIPKSAIPIGPFFRHGLEFYVDNKAGNVLFMHVGNPGSKNMNSVAGETVARFKMKGVAPGKTEFTIAGKGFVFHSATGVKERFGLTGGQIEITAP